jgi:hypothetical protein
MLLLDIKHKVQQLHQKFSLTLENHLFQVSDMLCYQELLIMQIYDLW